MKGNEGLENPIMARLKEVLTRIERGKRVTNIARKNQMPRCSGGIQQFRPTTGFAVVESNNSNQLRVLQRRNPSIPAYCGFCSGGIQQFRPTANFFCSGGIHQFRPTAGVCVEEKPNSFHPLIDL